MSPVQVLAFVAHVEDWLARIFHTRPAAALDSDASAALPLLASASLSNASRRTRVKNPGQAAGTFWIGCRVF
jgi:hypothetical protein